MSIVLDPGAPPPTDLARRLAERPVLQKGPLGALHAQTDTGRAWLTPGGELILERLAPNPAGPGDVWTRTRDPRVLAACLGGPDA